MSAHVHATALPSEERARLGRRAQLLAATSVAYNLVEAVIAISAGIVAGSVALVGFGLDSVVEVSSGLIILWQFRHRLPESRERQALRLMALSFFALAAYVGFESVRALLSGHDPESSHVGIGLAIASLCVMPFLSWAQRRTGRALGSNAVVADSTQTLLCTYLSAVLLVGLGLNATLGWSWADPVAGLVIAAVAVKEGREAWRGESCCGGAGVPDGSIGDACPSAPHTHEVERACRAARETRHTCRGARTPGCGLPHAGGGRARVPPVTEGTGTAVGRGATLEPETADEPDLGTDYAAFFDRTLRWLLTVTGVVGLVAAFTLTVEKIALIADPDYVPTCSISPVLSCGSIMDTQQAELFGFPNPLIGVVAFAVLITTGVVLATGARLPRWYWLGLQVGSTLGFLFIGWLVGESLYDIGALCPYCMVVWAVVIPAFWYVTLANLTTGRFGRRAADSRAVAVLAENHAVVLMSFYLVVVVLVLQRFWDYWVSLV